MPKIFMTVHEPRKRVFPSIPSMAFPLEAPTALQATGYQQLHAAQPPLIAPTTSDPVTPAVNQTQIGKPLRDFFIVHHKFHRS